LSNCIKLIGLLAQYAKEGSVFQHVLCLLRSNPHSGLDELVAQNSDYHIAPNGKVYSDHCSVKELIRLRRRLDQKFYSKRQLLRILDKGRRTGLLKLFFSQGSSHPARFVYSLLKAWVAGHRR
jgi:hypothetical protein